MKKFQGFNTLWVIVGVLAVIFLGVAAYLIIDGNNKATDFNSYDFTTIIEPTKDNGNIGDHIKGDKDAPVVIVEYADYQCEYCAMMNPHVNKIVEELDGKLAVVYRNFLLSYHQNNRAAAAAAEAAGLQGYWKEYMNKLFTEQSEWSSASSSERTVLFNKYFREVAGSKGDIDKFSQDIASENVKKKISFDMGIAKRINVGGTPAFYIDGQFIGFGEKDGGEVTINGKTISWDHALNTDEFSDIMKQIVSAKLGE